jgi:hypothetical protein
MKRHKTTLSLTRGDARKLAAILRMRLENLRAYRKTIAAMQHWPARERAAVATVATWPARECRGYLAVLENLAEAR